MRLAIADPPYLGRAEMLYGHRDVARMNFGNGPGLGRRTRSGAKSGSNQLRKADRHPDAAAWDDPEQHRAMVARLVADFDGWAVAMLPAHLRTYLPWVPTDTRVAVWHDPRVMPTGAHPRRRWEPVLVYVPAGRRRIVDVPNNHVGDVLTIQHPQRSKFAGAKPHEWTRWVLDMLGYQEGDTVEDLFPGSGAVSAEVAQLVIDL